MIEAGATFINPNPRRGLDPHLWVIVSDPSQYPDDVLIVNFTTRRDGCDESCIVEPGEHPFVQHSTVVEYRGARRASDQQLDQLLARTQFELREPVSRELLARIRAGAAVSEFISHGNRRLLEDQGVLPLDDGNGLS